MRKYILLFSFVIATVAVSQNLTVNNQIGYGKDAYLMSFTTNVTCNITNSTADNNPITFSIPGNTLGSNGFLRATVIAGYPNATANNKIIKFKLGGTVFKSFTTSGILNSGMVMQVTIANRNNPASQISVAGNAAASYGTINSQPGTGSVDTTTAQNFQIGVSNQSTTDSVNIESVNLEIYRRN